MEKVRVGFIGAGGIASRHVGNLLGFPDVTIVGLADPDRARAEEQAARIPGGGGGGSSSGGGKAWADWRQMLDEAEIDALYLCVPPFVHGEPELAALDLGLPFFVEKPLAVDLDTAERVSARVDELGVATAVGYHWRYLDTTERARQLLHERPPRLALGYWLDFTPPVGWWIRQDRSGGQMVEQTTHIFDVARYLLGEAESVTGVAVRNERPEYPDQDVADVSVATVRYRSGAVGTFASTCLLRWPHRIGLHVVAEGMMLELSEFELMVDVGNGRPVHRAEGDPFVREDRDFIDAVLGREDRVRTPYRDALETHRLGVAAREAAETGREVRLGHAETVDA